MKTSILAIFLIFMSTFYSFGKNPPDEIQKRFKIKFPNITEVNWRKESKDEWVAEFTVNNLNVTANFALDGSWLETEKEIPISSLPENVVDSIQKYYPDWKIVEADKIDTAKKEFYYEAVVKSGLKMKGIILNRDGSIADKH